MIFPFFVFFNQVYCVSVRFFLRNVSFNMSAHRTLFDILTHDVDPFNWIATFRWICVSCQTIILNNVPPNSFSIFLTCHYFIDFKNFTHLVIDKLPHSIIGNQHFYVIFLPFLNCSNCTNFVNVSQPIIWNNDIGMATVNKLENTRKSLAEIS